MIETKEDQIERVIEMCKKGDMSEFEVLYNHFYTTVYYTAYHFFNNEAKAQDALQNTFIEVFHKISTLRNPSSFAPWIRRITYRKCLNMIAYEKKDTLYYIQHDDSDIQSLHSKSDATMKQFSMGELFQLLIECLESLDERKRMIGHLKFLESYTAKEIADMMGINKETVNTNIRRIRVYVKNFLAEHGYTGEDFLSVATASALGMNYQDYVTSLPEMKHEQFIRPKKKKKTKKHTKSLFAIGSIAMIGSVALGGYAITNKESLTKSVQALFHITAKITDISYPHDMTNQPISLNVKTTSAAYDDIHINNKKTSIVKKNGTYEVAITKNNKIIDKQSIHIRNIDIDEPYMFKKVEEKQKAILYFKDNVAIDQTFIEVYANDVLQDDISLNKKNNTITLTKDVLTSYHIRLKDTAGNISEFYINFKL